MTIPRELAIKHIGEQRLVTSKPIAELDKLRSKTLTFPNLQVNKNFDLGRKTGANKTNSRIDIQLDKPDDLSIVLSNDDGEKTIIGFDKKNNNFFIDRTLSGKTDFNKKFAAKHFAPRWLTTEPLQLTLFIDVSSVELFADDGLSVMTEIFFPNKPYNHLNIQATDSLVLKKLDFTALKGIW